MKIRSIDNVSAYLDHEATFRDASQATQISKTDAENQITDSFTTDTPDQGTQVQAAISAAFSTLRRQQLDSSSHTPVISVNKPVPSQAIALVLVPETALATAQRNIPASTHHTSSRCICSTVNCSKYTPYGTGK